MHQPGRLVNHVRLGKSRDVTEVRLIVARLGRNCGLDVQVGIRIALALAVLRLTLYRLTNMDHASQGRLAP
jgi:hypothetical protein